MLQLRRRRAAALALGVAIGLSGLGPYALANRPDDHDHEPADSEEHFSIDVGDVDIALGGLLNNVNVGNGNVVNPVVTLAPTIPITITGINIATAVGDVTTGDINVVDAMITALETNVTGPLVGPLVNVGDVTTGEISVVDATVTALETNVTGPLFNSLVNLGGTNIALDVLNNLTVVDATVTALETNVTGPLFNSLVNLGGTTIAPSLLNNLTVVDVTAEILSIM